MKLEDIKVGDWLVWMSGIKNIGAHIHGFSFEITEVEDNRVGVLYKDTVYWYDKVLLTEDYKTYDPVTNTDMIVAFSKVELDKLLLVKHLSE